MSKFFMVVLVGFLVAGCDNGTPQGASEISVQGAHAVLLEGETTGPFLFLDVRTPDEYKGGHVPGAKNVPVQVLADHLAEVPKTGKVFVYCESGVRSTRATKLLVNAGYTNIVNMKASMRGWRGAGFETER